MGNPYADPFGLVAFRVPLGWSLHPESSTLTRLRLASWARFGDVELHIVATPPADSGKGNREVVCGQRLCWRSRVDTDHGTAHRIVVAGGAASLIADWYGDMDALPYFGRDPLVDICRALVLLPEETSYADLGAPALPEPRRKFLARWIVNRTASTDAAIEVVMALAAMARADQAAAPAAFEAAERLANSAQATFRFRLPGPNAAAHVSRAKANVDRGDWVSALAEARLAIDVAGSRSVGGAGCAELAGALSCYVAASTEVIGPGDAYRGALWALTVLAAETCDLEPTWRAELVRLLCPYLAARGDETALSYALTQAERAVASLPDEAPPDDRAMSRLGLAEVHRLLGRPAEALAALESVRAGLADLRPDVRAPVATMLAALGAPVPADARRVPPGFGSPANRFQDRLHAQELLDLAEADASPARASPLIRNAMELLLRSGLNSPQLPRAFELALRLTDPPPDLAFDLAVANVAVAESNAVTFASEDDRTGFWDADARRTAYRNLLEVTAAVDTVGGYMVLEANDRNRSRLLREGMTGASISYAPPLRVDDTPISPDPESAFRTASARVIKAVERRLSEVGLLFPTTPDDLIEVVKALSGPLICYFEGGGRLGAVVVRPESSCGIHWLGSEDEILPVVRALLRRFGVNPSGIGSQDHPELLGLTVPDLASRLSVYLLDPIRRCLPKKGSLVVVPSRDLALVPFALLGDPGDLLGDEHSLSLTPAIGVLRTIKLRGDFWDGRAPIRAFVGSQCEPLPDRGLVRLVHADEEASAVAGSLAELGPVELRPTPQCTRQALEHGVAGGARIIHLACHAQARTPGPSSSLFLAPSQDASGTLLASEIANLEVNDALVFLSACETGGGESRSEGVMGMTRSFLNAGARAVIASLWQVSDAVAAYFSTSFYAHAIRDATFQDALQLATLAAREACGREEIVGSDGKPLPDTFATWGSFVIVGDGGARLRPPPAERLPGLRGAPSTNTAPSASLAGDLGSTWQLADVGSPATPPFRLGEASSPN